MSHHLSFFRVTTVLEFFKQTETLGWHSKRNSFLPSIPYLTAHILGSWPRPDCLRPLDTCCMKIKAYRHGNKVKSNGKSYRGVFRGLLMAEKLESKRPPEVFLNRTQGNPQRTNLWHPDSAGLLLAEPPSRVFTRLKWKVLCLTRRQRSNQDKFTFLVGLYLPLVYMTSFNLHWLVVCSTRIF